MFTGIVEEIGTVVKNNRNSLVIAASKVIGDMKTGDSIAVNGACLTVTSFGRDSFTVDVMEETYDHTNLRTLKSGNKVNLERAMPLNGRFGGHIVSGHIDGVGTVTDIKKRGIEIIYSIMPPKDIFKYMVYKGSVAVDGISLTISYIDSNIFQVSVIPHTQQETVLTLKKQGDSVNLETDIIAAYVERLLTFKEEKGITEDFLRKYDF